MRRESGWGLSSTAVHSGSPEYQPGQPLVTPIAQTTTFFNDPEPAGEVLYTRYGNNPNHHSVAAKIAALEGAEAGIVLGSGMGAISLALLAHLSAGDHVLAADSLYGGTMSLLRDEFPHLGIETTFAPVDEFAAHVRDNTRVMYVELPVNPTLRVPDLPAVGRIAAERGIAVLVDATFATPINFRSLENGATVAIHSGTKYLGGHSDVTAGLVAASADVIERVRDKMKHFGTVLDPHAAWLLERGMKTLAIRMWRHNEVALAVARALETHARVARVHYPGLESHPDHDRARTLMKGFGGMLSIVVQGGDEAAIEVVRRLRMIRLAPSLGGVESLVSMPRFTSHVGLSREQRHAAGIDDGFLRISIGIEDPEDLIADLDQALGAATT